MVKLPLTEKLPISDILTNLKSEHELTLPYRLVNALGEKSVILLLVIFWLIRLGVLNPDEKGFYHLHADQVKHYTNQIDHFKLKKQLERLQKFEIIKELSLADENGYRAFKFADLSILNKIANWGAQPMYAKLLESLWLNVTSGLIYFKKVEYENADKEV